MEKEDINWINNILLNKIHDAKKCDIYAVIGTGERRYGKHLLPFIDYLKPNNNISFNLQLEDFKEHNKIAKIYPPFAREIVSDIIN